MRMEFYSGKGKKHLFYTFQFFILLDVKMNIRILQKPVLAYNYIEALGSEVA